MSCWLNSLLHRLQSSSSLHRQLLSASNPSSPAPYFHELQVCFSCERTLSYPRLPFSDLLWIEKSHWPEFPQKTRNLLWKLPLLFPRTILSAPLIFFLPYSIISETTLFLLIFILSSSTWYSSLINCMWKRPSITWCPELLGCFTVDASPFWLLSKLTDTSIGAVIIEEILAFRAKS